MQWPFLLLQSPTRPPLHLHDLRQHVCFSSCDLQQSTSRLLTSLSYHRYSTSISVISKHR
ncbi:hypothetical protein HID58_057813 [Brassica napus]|uniref:Uncharacterized protein n=1 Tax=Brassica napus TaxID=3708 RepID=A0ABQ7XFB6_BRANA|nr:hypothetical protein HID58_057813 [Brassica napus]